MILGAESITRKRYPAQTRSEATGEAVIGAPTSSSITAGVQPIGIDRQALPEGHRKKDARRVYTESELLTADQHAGTIADVLTIDGVDYLVVKTFPHRKLLAHYKALAVRVQEADPDV